MSLTDELQGDAAFSVKVYPDIAQRLHEIAMERQVPADTLVNEILQQFVADQAASPNSRGAAFLLSMAGMFHSGVDDTSENVRGVVTAFVIQKQAGQVP